MKPPGSHTQTLIGIIHEAAKERYVILAIFSLALLLRLIGSVLVYLIFDESAWLEAASKISFSPENFNLILHGDHHPPFEAYLIKISIILFSNNILSFMPEYIATLLRIRFLHVIICSATIVLMYYLVKNGLERSSATFAALLIAFSQYHIHYSRTVIQIAPFLFFVTLSLCIFWKSIKENNDTFIIFLGLSIGMGFLCEETASLLFPIFFIFLLITNRLVAWLKKWQTYVAILAFLIVITPDLYWNITAQSSDIKHHLAKAAKFQGLSLLSISLYVGEILLFFIQDIETFVGGLGRHAVWPIEYPTMHWVLGVLCLIAVIYSFKERRNEFITLMQTTFLFIFLFFTFFASSGPLGNFQYYWASTSFIPAIVLVSHLFTKVFQKNSFIRWLPVFLILYFLGHSLYFLSITDQMYVRRPSFLTKYYTDNGRNGLLKGDLYWAERNLKKALKYDSDSLVAMVNLAECYKMKGQDGQSAFLLRAAQERGLGPSDSRRLLFDRGYLKEWLISEYYKVSDLNDLGMSHSSVVKYTQELEGDKTSRGAWRHQVKSLSAFIDLKSILNNPPHIFSHACTEIYSPREQRIKLLVGADDGITIWLNGVKVYENNTKLLWFPDEDTINVAFTQGWNKLLVKVVYDDGHCYGFTIRLADSTGEIIDTIPSRALCS